MIILFFATGENWSLIFFCAATGLGLVIFGQLKSIVTRKSQWREMLEIVTLGGLAAFVAYYVGFGLEKILVN